MRTTLSKIKNTVLNLSHLKENRLCRERTPYNIMYGFRRIYFYHTRKTGGTSLNHIFLSLGGEKSETVYERIIQKPNHRIIINDKVFVAWNRWFIQQGHYFYAFSHIPHHELRLPQEPQQLPLCQPPP